MDITFNVSKYAGDARSLINLLHSLSQHGAWTPYHYPEIEKITCRTPSSALKYAKLVMRNGISNEAEKVFLKNPGIGVRYLIQVKKKSFSSPEIQTKFWKKLKRDPWVALPWSHHFGRLPEEDEEVFLKSMRCMRDYAYFIIKGGFPEKIHNMILLKSYETMPDYEKKSLGEYLKYVS